MKFLKLLLFLVGAYMMPQTAEAQHPMPQTRNEFTFNVGVWPVISNTSSAFKDNDYFSPVDVSFEFMHHAAKRFSLGFDFSYSPILEDSDRNSNSRYPENNVFNHNNKYSGSIFLIMPTFRMEWIRHHSFTLYSRVALGLGIQTGTERYDYNVYDTYSYERRRTEKSTHCGFVYQVVPLGITFGRELFGRLEFPGIGYEGLASLGIGYRF